MSADEYFIKIKIVLPPCFAPIYPRRPFIDVKYSFFHKLNCFRTFSKSEDLSEGHQTDGGDLRMMASEGGVIMSGPRACPGCGQVSSSSTDRLVVDTCGHVKCRKCLLVEDSQCGQCHDMAWDRSALNIFCPMLKSFSQTKCYFCATL